MEVEDETIAIIGAGNLGTSLVNGLINSNKFSATNFSLSKRKITSLSSFSEKGCVVTNNNRDAVKNADIVVLAVLPQKIELVNCGNCVELFKNIPPPLLEALLKTISDLLRIKLLLLE